MKFFTSLLALAFACVASADLLVVKDFASTEIVQNRNVTVRYNAFNTGDNAVYDVNLIDSSYANANIQIADAPDALKFDVIEPHSNKSIEITVVPLMWGIQEWGPSLVEYKPTADAETIKVTYSTSIGRLNVESEYGHYRRTALHLQDWAIFAGLAAIPVGIPAIISLMYKSPSQQKNKKQY